MLQISVIICAYTEERWTDLVLAVRSVQAQTQRPLEIIVVIDHNPVLLARARQQLPGVVVVANSAARGLSGARNSGIAVAQGDVLAFMDEDAQSEPNWLARLAQGYTEPEVMGVGGAIEPRWQQWRPTWFPPEFDWVVGCTYQGMPVTAAPVRNLIGCNMSLRREVFQAVGGFRYGIGRIGKVPVGCEETELCIRAQQHWPTRRLLYDPRARVRHRVPAARSTWRYFAARCYAEGRSKALITRFIGTKDGLASERTYTLRTLPQGVWQGVVDTLFKGKPTGLVRAGAIIAGLSMTAAGYFTHRLLNRLAPAAAPSKAAVAG